MIENLMVQNSTTITKTLVPILAVVSVFISMYYAVNIPMWDDYHIILVFLNNFVQANGFLNKLDVLFSADSNYLFTTLKLFVLSDYYLYGQINFTHLILINNLFHLGIYYTVYQLFQKNSRPLQYFFPIILLLAIPNNEVQNWASYTVHVAAIYFILATINALSNPGLDGLWKGFILAVLAIFSAPVGFITLLCVFPILYYKYERKWIIIWYIAFFGIGLIYFLLMLPFGSEITGVVSAKPGLIVYLMNIVVFYGSLFKDFYGELHIWAVFLGGMMTLFFGHYFLRRLDRIKRNTILGACLLFSMLLALVLTAMRSKHGLGATTPPRYRLFQELPLIFIYLYFLVENWDSIKRYYPAILAISFMFYGFRIEKSITALQEAKNYLESGMHTFQIADIPDHLSHGNPVLAAEILETSRSLGVYVFEDLDLSESEIHNPKRSTRQQSMEYLIESQLNDVDFYMLRGWAFPSHSPMHELKVLLVIKDVNGTHYFNSGPFPSNAVLMGKSENGFIATIDKRKNKIDWISAEVGMALYHPIQGIIAETFIVQ